MTVKHDRVNRVSGLVYLPIDGRRFNTNRHVTLTHVNELDIDCYLRDTMAMKEPIDGNAIGDAVFDAMLATSFSCDAMMPYGVGSIIISKILSGSGYDPEMLFNITVTILHPNNGVSIEESTDYTIKAGQIITIDGIADASEYIVTENVTPKQVLEGYTLETITNSTGIVRAFHSADVTIYNRYDRPMFYGALIISVNVSGSGFDINKVFKVTVRFNEPVNYSINGGLPIEQASTVYVAKLTHGQTVTLGHILVGAVYTVVAVPLSETDINNGYIINGITGNTGTITRDASSLALVNYGYYGSTGSLIVTAIVDNPDSDKVLHIAVTFSKVIEYSVNGGTPLSNGLSIYMAELRHNESVTISNIPNGVTYAVTPSITDSERSSGYSPDTTDGAYPRSGVIKSSDSPAHVVVSFSKTNE